MRLSRLVLEANQNRVSLAFHPKLTVVAGVAAPVREHLTEEILGGFTGSRPGVHLELENGSGRCIRVLRPHGGPHRVSAPDEGLDLTDDFRNQTGRIDVLDRYGLDSSAARRILHVGADSARHVTIEDAHIARLSGLNQAELWSSAARVQVTHAEFVGLSEKIAQSDDDAEAVATIERRHQSVETAIASQQMIERNLVRLTALALVAALPLAVRSDLGVVPLVVIAASAMALALFLRAKVGAARRGEDAALTDAGSDSYLGYVVKQVDGMLSDTEQRRRYTAVAADHRAAAMAWTRLVDDVTVDWALAHQPEIDAAARLRNQLAAMNTTSAEAPQIDERTAAIARSVLGRMAELRRIGYGAESFPLILDDPFALLPPATRIALLELIMKTAGSPQVILLTELDDVADWAREQSRSGEVAILEPLGPKAPTGRHAESEDAGGSADGAEADHQVDHAHAEAHYGTAARGLAV